MSFFHMTICLFLYRKKNSMEIIYEHPHIGLILDFITYTDKIKEPS